ncbi:MAG: hypothetical protein COT18_05475, partial [Elusimicrobia bacterium CG08_land_8_20_14_0_20_59_10]
MRAEERLSAKTIQAFKPAAPGRSCCGGHEAPGYRARAPGSPLSRIVLNNLQEFERWLKNPAGSQPPRPQPGVITALEKFIECGVMRYGAVRFRCPKCGHDVFVALSCKRRGCPSCDAKRSAIITGQALERLLAFVPYRQWVLVVPKRLRYFLNHDPALAGGLSRIFAEEINRFLCQSATGTPAQLHFIQRFGGALNLHIHVHAVVSDGVFSLKMNVLGRSEVVF